MNSEEIYLLVSTGDSKEIIAFVEHSPDNSFKEAALGLVSSGNLATRALGLTSMVMEYCQGRDPSFGAMLAEATHRLAHEIFMDEKDHGGLLPTTISNLASQHLNALNLLGQSEAAIEAADRYIPIYQDLNELENLPAIELACATALFNVNRIDDSLAVLKKMDCSKNPGSMIGRDRLINIIENLKSGATEIKALSGDVSLHDSILKASEKSDFSVLGEEGEALKLISKMLGDKKGNPSLDPNDFEHFKKSLGLLDAGESMLSHGGTAKTELTMRKLSRDATAIFHPGSLVRPSPERIESSLEDLQGVRNWAIENCNKEILHDALWGIYLCQSRLDRSSEAADALIELRNGLEVQRAGILDPVRRAGAFSTYPQLFNVSCERLCNAGRYFELLETIEASKGRAIADILTRKQNRPVPDADVYGAVSKLPELARTHRFNYLSFYLDRYEGEATIYAVMVCKDGNAYSTEPVKLDEAALDGSLVNLDPDRWGATDYRRRRVPDASEVLAPIARLIGELFEQGVLESEDHICYTADEQLNNIPIQYLPFADGLLIDAFSFSRIHNVAQLEYLLEDAPIAPDHAEVFVVPSAQDLKKGNWDDTRENLFRPGRLLDEFFDVEVFSDEEASIDQWVRHDLPHGVLHFSTHGIDRIANPNPYTGSGLVLSDGKTLPDRNSIARGDFGAVLTPQKLVDSEIDLRDSHVSMMACVSGLSQEGLGGDALGLDWALVNAGARSILSSHWNVSAKLAADFFESFYHYWLGEKQSKATAYRNSVRDMQQKHGAEDRHQFLAFSLSGDWR